jgi:6-pyruvoyltetrahydropterin/6-carboxytetrahydropterin synthase
MEGPEGELHTHDYRLEVIVTRSELDDRGMVCDLDVLEAAVAGAVAQVADRDLEIIRPPEAPAVTVEVFARWAHGTIAAAISSSGADHLAVRMWENPIAFGGYGGPIGG